MDYKARLTKVQKLLPKFPCDALLIEHPINLFYLTGQELSTGKLIITPKDAVLIVDGRYTESCKQQSLYPILKLEDETLKNWLSSHSVKSLAFDAESTTYQVYVNLKKMTDSLALDLKPTSSPLAELRLIKDQEEIVLLRKACNLCYKGYEFIIEHLKTGVKEEELALELELFWKVKGAKKLSFEPIIAFGPHSSMPHYRAGQTQLTPNTSILIDIGVAYKHYHSDMTRVVYHGEPPAAIQKIYPIVAEAKEKAFSLCRPGTLVGELDKAARSWITEKGYGEAFNHSLGHGVGLDVHETPLVRTKGLHAATPLQAGMVITIEPGIYLPGMGGVRLEDTLLITDQGYEILTQ